MFQFININHGKDAKPSDAKTRNIIRKQAMQKAGLWRQRKGKVPRYALDLQDSASLPASVIAIGSPVSRFFISEVITDDTSEENSDSQRHCRQTGSRVTWTVKCCQSFARDPADCLLGMQDPFPLLSISYLDPGCGRRNPFIRYPLDMDLQMHILIDHLSNDIRINWRISRTLWLPATITDASAFYQLLSNICLGLGALDPSNNEYSQLSLVYHRLAVRSVNNRLSNFARHDAGGIISSILALAGYANILADYEMLNSHLEAIMKVVKLAGGWPELELPEQARTLLSSIDRRHEVDPRLQIPLDISPTHCDTVESFVLSNSSLPQPFADCDPDCETRLSDVLQDLSTMDKSLNHELSTDFTIWENAFDYQMSGISISPPLRRILMIQPRSEKTKRLIFPFQEAVRVAALLSLASIKRRSNSFHEHSRLHLTRL
ncbi:hypothetical protein NA57DRAFT_76468 [Rhizodiscina lignyota]|uniref:Uncharacterized protein n=1 Tax=Rhizodiscina lignyota TaxID=1504668 RepID=A0A9P4M6G3_9PEZI|nr:hypothetical protein NA57DRAFT_76468 [Rhizodiscina lignyota]